MKTLIIHPKDKTTDFLTPLYRNLKNKTVVKGNISKSDILNLINHHDRVIMLGHGSSAGLFSVGQFTGSSNYIIDEETVPLLSEKENNVCIWCNADIFCRRFCIRGFFSGMFVSELTEAYMMGLKDTDESLIEESNKLFADIASKYISDKDSRNICERIKREYFGERLNPVINYNSQRLSFLNSSDQNQY